VLKRLYFQAEGVQVRERLGLGKCGVNLRPFDDWEGVGHTKNVSVESTSSKGVRCENSL